MVCRKIGGLKEMTKSNPEPALIAGSYTLAELTVPNRKAVRA